MSSQLERIASFYNVSLQEVQSWSGPRKLAAYRTVEAAETTKQKSPDGLAQRIASGSASSLDLLTAANRAERTAHIKAAIAPLPKELEGAPAVKKLAWLEKQREKARLERELAALDMTNPHAQWRAQDLHDKLKRFS